MKTFSCLWLLFLSIGLVANAQDSKIDSLKTVVSHLLKKPATVERDSLLTVSIHTICSTISLTEPDLRQAWTDSLSKFSKISMWKQSVAYSQLANGRNHHFMGFATLSMKEIELSIALFKKFKNDKMYAVAFSSMAVEITNFIYNKPITDNTSEKKYLIYLTEALEIAKKQGNPVQIANMNLSLLVYYMKNRSYQAAKQCAVNAWQVTKSDPDKYFYYYYAGKWMEGLNLLYLGKPKEGFRLINEAKAVAQKPRKDGMEKYFWANDGLSLGKYYIEKKEYENAIQEAKFAEDGLKSMKAPIFDYALNKIFYEAYKNTNKPAEALIYLEKMQVFEQEEQHKETLGQYSEWQLKYQDERQKTQIKTLENEKLQTEANGQKWIRNILIFGLLSGLGLGLYFFRNNQKLKAKNREIEEALLKGQNLERKRVASELHDNLSAKITGLRWRFESLSPEFHNPKEEKIYQNSIDALDEIYSDVRLISHNLLPADLETKGLTASLTRMISEFNQLGKTVFRLEENINSERFNSKIEYEIFTICLELTHNVLRHSQAKEAKLAFKKVNNQLIIIMLDNGIGMSLDKDMHGVGLKSIEQRVQNLSGRLTILEKEKRAEVQIIVPI